MCINIMSFLFLYNFSDLDLYSRTSYMILIFSTIFGFTSMMDGYKWGLIFEIIRSLVGLVIILYFFEQLLIENSTYFVFGFGSYFIITFLLTAVIGPGLPKRLLSN